MQLRNEDFHFTQEAATISDRIEKKLNPIFEDCIRGGLTAEDFFYLVSNAANKIMLLGLWDKENILRLRAEGERESSMQENPNGSSLEKCDKPD